MEMHEPQDHARFIDREIGSKGLRDALLEGLALNFEDAVVGLARLGCRKKAHLIGEILERLRQQGTFVDFSLVDDEDDEEFNELWKTQMNAFLRFADSQSAWLESLGIAYLAIKEEDL